MLSVAQTHIIEVLKLLENICTGKLSGEIVASKPDTAYIKITDSVKRITGGGLTIAKQATSSLLF